MNRQPETLLDKLWTRRVVADGANGGSLLYVDRHLVYEVTSPQAFEGLRLAGRRPRRPLAVLATVDHNVPTRAQDRDQLRWHGDAMARMQICTLHDNCREFGITAFGLSDPRQGIIHVIGPEQGATLPGMTVVAGDSHTSTHGAFAALAFGIGTSDVEHVLATQCIWVNKPAAMEIRVDGALSPGVSAKDLALHIIAAIGSSGAAHHAIEFRGEAVRALSMEARMTLCNMSIEAGARFGLVGVDQTTIDYLRGRPLAPGPRHWDAAVAQWRQLRTDPGATFDRVHRIDAGAVAPMVSWGTSPDMAVPVHDSVPDPAGQCDPGVRGAMERALRYMDLRPGMAMRDIALDRVFIGSCTNARIEDLRAAAAKLRGRRIAATIRQALVVPGSGLVKAQAEAEGLHRVFEDAGYEWRAAGCSMCLGMNDDRLRPGERCASTSNRNFEGRQGSGGRTHLVSPAMAAAASVAGHFVDVREGAWS